MSTNTDYSKKISTLSEFWFMHRESEEYKDFIEYNTVGLPLSFMLNEGMCKEVTDKGLALIEESYSQLCEMRIETPSEELERFFV